jgi:hypothetical protein
MIDLRRTLAQPHLLRRIVRHGKRPDADFPAPSWTSPKRSPADTLPAEQSFLTAIGIAQQQKACSFELRAAHSLAKFYHSLGRFGDAYAALTPILEGFTPTPYLPQIGEAQALLTMLAETDEVKGIIAEAGCSGPQTAGDWCDQCP